MFVLVRLECSDCAECVRWFGVFLRCRAVCWLGVSLVSTELVALVACARDTASVRFTVQVAHEPVTRTCAGLLCTSGKDNWKARGVPPGGGMFFPALGKTKCTGAPHCIFWTGRKIVPVADSLGSSPRTRWTVGIRGSALKKIEVKPPHTLDCQGISSSDLLCVGSQ